MEDKYVMTTEWTLVQHADEDCTRMPTWERERVLNI
jgi:hypothetical protein